VNDAFRNTMEWAEDTRLITPEVKEALRRRMSLEMDEMSQSINKSDS